MLNLSLSCLTLGSLVLRSPFLSPASAGCYSLSGLKVHKSFSAVLYSACPLSVRMHRCAFQRFLESPVQLLTKDINISGLFTERFKKGKANVTMQACQYSHCNGTNGGAACVSQGVLTITESLFEENQAEIGGAIYTRNCLNLTLSHVLFIKNQAEHDGAVCGGMNSKAIAKIMDVNVTRNAARLWTGGIRIESVGGTVKNCRFDSNVALVSGCFFDWAWNSIPRNISECVFTNNTCVARGGAYTSNNIGQTINFDQCVFLQNACEKSADSISLENVDAVCTITRCRFSGTKENEVGMRYPESVIKFDDCEFEH